MGRNSKLYSGEGRRKSEGRVFVMQAGTNGDLLIASPVGGCHRIDELCSTLGVPDSGCS